jgi:signal transduction histidine kinase
VRVRVRDSDPGFARAALERVFEPFYTTKPEGMGMGLSICRSIIEAHGGRLWATGYEPRGALFQFTTPLTEPPSVINVVLWHFCDVSAALSNVRV